MRHRVLALAGLISGMCAQAQAGDWSVLIPYEDHQSIAAGQVIYSDNCASCHGDDLKGEPNWRIRDENGYLPAPPHDETGHTWHHPDTQLFATVKLGVEHLVGEGYPTRMEGFGEVLSDDQILQSLAYIKSTWPARVIEAHNRINEDAKVAGD